MTEIELAIVAVVVIVIAFFQWQSRSERIALLERWAEEDDDEDEDVLVELIDAIDSFLEESDPTAIVVRRAALQSVLEKARGSCIR